MAPPLQAPHPPAVLEFLLFLNRVEDLASGRKIDAFVGDDELDEEDEEVEDDDIQRCKLRAYQEELQRRVAQWEGLDAAHAETYRSRIENLLPAFELTIERQRLAAAKPLQEATQIPTEARPIEQEPHVAELPRPPTDAGLMVEQADDDERQAPADTKEDAPPVPATTSPPTAVATNTTPTTTGTTAANAAPDLRWRRSRPTGLRGPEMGGARAGILQEMETMSGSMIDVAQKWQKTIVQDNQCLEAMKDDLGKDVDSVKKQTAKGKDMMRSSNLSFMCTMLMLIISIVLFLMMIPFIIFT